MKRMRAAAALAAVAASAGAGPASGAVPLEGWDRAGTGQADSADGSTLSQIMAGTAQDAAFALQGQHEAPPLANPWTLLAVGALALGYVLAQRQR
jgi:hypothetical protein